MKRKRCSDEQIIGIPKEADAAADAYWLPSDLFGEHRAKALPPQADRLIADVDASFGEQALYLCDQQRVLQEAHTTNWMSSGDELKRPNGVGGLTVEHGDNGAAPLPAPFIRRCLQDRDPSWRQVSFAQN